MLKYVSTLSIRRNYYVTVHIFRNKNVALAYYIQLFYSKVLSPRAKIR
jgi:hypothetical protein